MKALLDLGANPNFKNSVGETPYDYCSDGPSKELLRPYHEAMLKQEAAVKEEALRQEAEAKIKGTWEARSADEIVHEYDLPGHRLHRTEVFNFAASSWDLITENLQTGQMSPPQTKFFSEIPDEGKAMIDEAQSQLDKANSVVPAETAPLAEAQKQNTNRLRINPKTGA